MGGGLGALPHGANRFQILESEAIFIAVDDDAIRIDVEGYSWRISVGRGSGEAVVVCILE